MTNHFKHTGPFNLYRRKADSWTWWQFSRLAVTRGVTPSVLIHTAVREWVLRQQKTGTKE